MSKTQPRNVDETLTAIKQRLLDKIGEIQGVPIPDVTIQGTDFRSAARHLVDETKEVDEQLERIKNNNACLTAYSNDFQILLEVIDVIVMGLSTANAFAKKYNEVIVNEAVKIVLDKNADRGYYDIDNPLHVDDMLSGSAQRARQERE